MTAGVDWERITALALALPGTEAATSYGRPAIKVRGKNIIVAGKTDDHFVLMVPIDEVEMLKDTGPACFFQTPHYEGWPDVLVRYASADVDRVAGLIERAWAARASKAQLSARR